MLFLIKMYIGVGLRTPMFKVLMVSALFMVFVAWLASGFSGRQPMSMMLDFGFSALRIMLVFMALMWLQELLGKAIDKRYITQVLAYPLPKHSILLANYIATALLLLLALVCVAAVLLLAAHLGAFYEQARPPALGWPYVTVWGFIYLDILLVLAFALLITSFSITPQLPLLFGLGFFVIGHGIGPILDYLLEANTADQVHKDTIAPLLSYVRYIVPELSRLDFRHISLYSEAIDAAYALKQVVFALSYTAFLLCSSVFCFNRREFQ